MSRFVGIDLGTTNSAVAILENGRPEVIQNAEGSKTTPSVVLYGNDGEVVVGELAKRQTLIDPTRAMHSVKRFMGTRWEEIEDRREGIAYELCSDGDGMTVIDTGSGRVRPESVSAEILKKMKETAEAYLGEEVSHAVITVPAHFNDGQRTATKLAAEKAGLELLRIINEPTAAALAYGFNRREHRQTIAVFDFGGGTFDITILEIESDIFEVKSTGGDNYLGGDNINHILADWIATKIQSEFGLDPRADIHSWQRIAEAAEKTKCELSTLTKTLISLPYILSDGDGPKHFSTEVPREEFNALISPVLRKLRAPCKTAMEDAGLNPEDLAAVLLVGGSTRIPAVHDLVREVFGKDPEQSLNPDEVVACGAALQAGIMNGDLDEILLLDVTPLSLGIELAEDVFASIIPRNSNVPTSVTRKFTTVIDNQKTVKVHALQGERKIASENRSLGHFRLPNIPPAPKEIPEIEIKFHLDANGILTITAMDLTSGNLEELDVESYSPGMEDEAEKIAESAAEHAEEDRIFMQKVAVKRRLEEMESAIESIRQRRGEKMITAELDQSAKEAFFKLDVALGQNEWKMIEDAERQARGLFVEITSIAALKSAGQVPEVTIREFSEAGAPAEGPEAEPD